MLNDFPFKRQLLNKYWVVNHTLFHYLVYLIEPMLSQHSVLIHFPIYRIEKASAVLSYFF